MRNRGLTFLLVADGRSLCGRLIRAVGIQGQNLWQKGSYRNEQLPASSRICVTPPVNGAAEVPVSLSASGHRLGTHAVKNTIQYGVAGLRHEDLRYHRSGKHGFGPADGICAESHCYHSQNHHGKENHRFRQARWKFRKRNDLESLAACPPPHCFRRLGDRRNDDGSRRH